MDAALIPLTKDHLKALNGFLAKADGKDKLTALVQYAAMFVSAGEAGNAKKVQVSVAAARKVFRIFRPLESVSPIIYSPHLNPAKPVVLELINKLKLVLNAIYFGADHVVWAGQAGIYLNKESLERWQKTSLWSWFGASSCTIVNECYELAQIAKTHRKNESLEAWRQRQSKAFDEINQRLLTLFHACVQAALAMGLLGVRPWKPRFVGFLGVVASAINCYMLYPALPAPASAPAPKPAPTQLGPPKLEVKAA